MKDLKRNKELNIASDAMQKADWYKNRSLSSQMLLKSWAKEAIRSIKERNLTDDTEFDAVKENIKEKLEFYNFPSVFFKNLNSFSKKSDKVYEKFMKILKDMREHSRERYIAQYDLNQILGKIKEFDNDLDKILIQIKNVSVKVY